MRPLLTGLALLGGLAIEPAAAEPLDLTVQRIEHFRIAGSGEPEGPLHFRGGLQLTSDNRAFGGFSGIAIAADGSVAMLSDAGSVVRARLVRENGQLSDVTEAEIDTLFPDGRLSKEVGDAEDIAFDPTDPNRGVIVRERQANAMLTFEIVDGRTADFRPKRVGADDRLLGSNKGLESTAFAPPGSPLAGEVIAIAERAPRGMTNIPGWIAGVGQFEILPHDGFDVSSARFLPNGDLLLLERRYSPGWGIAMRLRRIDGATIAPGATLDGPILLDAGMAFQIDNMEGMAVHQDEKGRTILTLISDDNYSILQRTLILEFALADD
jgi:hypothetical protein